MSVQPELFDLPSPAPVKRNKAKAPAWIRPRHGFFGHPAIWQFMLLKDRLRHLFEGSDMPKGLSKELDAIGDAYIASPVVSKRLLAKRSRLFNQAGSGSFSLDECIDYLSRRIEQHDCIEWQRRGDTIRNRGKNSRFQVKPRGSEPDEDSGEAQHSDEVLDTLAEPKAPRVKPMDDDERAAFIAACAETVGENQGRDVVSVETPKDEAPLWFEIEWHLATCEITLLTEGVSGRQVIDCWTREIGRKSREFLPQLLRSKLRACIHLDADPTL